MQIGEPENTWINAGTFFHLKSTNNIISALLKPKHINEADGILRISISI